MKTHKLEPFNYFYCLVSEEELKAYAKRKKKNLPELPETKYGYAAELGSTTFVVTHKHDKYWEAVDTIIHESVHVFQAAMKYIGEDKVGCEMEAYSIATISTNLLKDYNALHDERET